MPVRPRCCCNPLTQNLGSFFTGAIANHSSLNLKHADNLHWDVVMLPTEKAGERHNSVVGGASLWVLAGKSEDEYRGVAEYLKFTSTPESIKFRVSNADYIPVMAGHKAFKIGMIWPYAIAAPATGLAFRFIFSPGAGIMLYVNHVCPHLWNPVDDGNPAMAMAIIAGAWKQVPCAFCGTCLSPCRAPIARTWPPSCSSTSGTSTFGLCRW